MNELEIQTSLDAQGILLATLDMPGRSMNVFSRPLMDALDHLITQVEQNAEVRAVVLTSGKPSFLVGADLDMIRVFTERAQIDDRPQMKDLCGHLGRVFRRLEQSSKPFVAAINGLALGGGLEVCMACHSRVAANDFAVRLGLPEVKLGLLPGAGGTQRLPRLIGAEKGLELLLGGGSVSSQEALSLGLVDVVVTPEQLLDTAKARAAALAGRRPVAIWDRPGVQFSAKPYRFSDLRIADAICQRLGIDADQRQHYPAIHAIIDCVVGGWDLDMTSACEREMDIFVELIRDPVAGNMVRTLFLNRQKAAKAGLLGPQSLYEVDDQALIPRLRAVSAEVRAQGLSESNRLLVLAIEAVQVWAEGKVAEPTLADVAVVAAGLFPDYTGGPFTFLDQSDSNSLRISINSLQSSDSSLLPGLSALEQWFLAREEAST